jgi:hypothetical protein
METRVEPMVPRMAIAETPGVGGLGRGDEGSTRGRQAG